VSIFCALSLSVVFLTVGSLTGTQACGCSPKAHRRSQPTRKAVRWAVCSPLGTLALPTTQPQTQQQPRAAQPHREFGCACGPHLASPQRCGVSVQAGSICVHTAAERPQAPYATASDRTSGSPSTNVDASSMRPQQGREKRQHCDSVGSAAPPEADEGVAEGGRQVDCDGGWRCCHAGNKRKREGACGRGRCVRRRRCFC